MNLKTTRGLASLLLLIGSVARIGASARVPVDGAGQAATPVPASVGSIKAIQGNSITLAPDSGSAINVAVQDSTRLLRVEPGQKSLKDATPAQLQDLQVGDRILVRGSQSADGTSLTASSILLMKKSAIQQKQQQEEQDWQRNGGGGLVKSVDASTGAIVISTGAGPTAKTVTITTSKETVLRRYASNSVKFSDSTPGTLDQIKPGDQLRARGTRNADGTTLAAREVVSGSFRNIAGTVISVDANAKEVSVNDLLTKQPVQVKLTGDSTIKKLPAMMAQMIATRLKGSRGGPPGDSGGGAQTQPPPRPESQGPAGGTEAHHWGGPGDGASGGRPDLQQFLNRLPQASLADLQKGDAVMIVSTEAGSGSPVTAITLLAGVEPILTAAPTSSQAASFMSGWTLGGGDAGGGGDGGP
ncbi:MAG TPA: DUF5666 domain-containing protein [Terriglobia bacterium]|nr:DUF5666 domain-containing protein [Terriglobia bacterium]